MMMEGIAKRFVMYYCNDDDLDEEIALCTDMYLSLLKFNIIKTHRPASVMLNASVIRHHPYQTNVISRHQKCIANIMDQHSICRHQSISCIVHTHPSFVVSCIVGEPTARDATLLSNVPNYRSISHLFYLLYVYMHPFGFITIMPTLPDLLTLCMCVNSGW